MSVYFVCTHLRFIFPIFLCSFSEFLPILLQETRQAVMSMTWLVDVGSQGDSALQAPKQKWFLRHDPLVPGFSRNLKPCRNCVKGLSGQQEERENDLLLSRKEVRG